ncbi:CamS family sex pheromone protein [Bacillus sp. FJAT-27245]|uniref:CamS family sex pheromone protein n=1 Tax=Bacillus sp. FJAT-27245 TaxID=1684144 RepID=UPI0006A7C274|nr:CamS family sex pheromone protein [Bacillus sp. FJAT-27245]
MKKLSIALLSLTLLLGACAPKLKKQEEAISDKETLKKNTIIPRYQISDSHYRTLEEFKPSVARGLTVNNLNTRYDINEFEMALMRIAKNTFNPEKYVFREGQYLKGDTVKAWLKRKYTKKQLEEREMKEGGNVGLNPVDDEVGEIEARNKKSPIYLAHIVEHDYLDNNKLKLGGVVIGLALNSVHYFQKEQYGDVFEVPIKKDVLEREGKKLAQEVLSRLREMHELRNVPITIALFEQESRDSIVPGSFFAYTTVKDGANISNWEKIDEEYFLFPLKKPKDGSYREDSLAFENFKMDVEQYFPDHNGVVGKAHYINGQLQEMDISITNQFYGKAEAIGFTQYVTGLVVEHFPKYISVSVDIHSINGPESLIVRKVDQEEPTVHIYN